MKLLGFLSEESVKLDIEATSKEELLKELLGVLVESGEIPKGDEGSILKSLMEREAKGSTGLGDGLAVPHVKDCAKVTGLTGVFGRAQTPIPYDAVDGRPVDLIFLILGGEGTQQDHIGILRKLAQLRMNEHFLRFLRDSEDHRTVVDTIRDMEASVA